MKDGNIRGIMIENKSVKNNIIERKSVVEEKIVGIIVEIINIIRAIINGIIS